MLGRRGLKRLCLSIEAAPLDGRAVALGLHRFEFPARGRQQSLLGIEVSCPTLSFMRGVGDLLCQLLRLLLV